MSKRDAGADAILDLRRRLIVAGSLALAACAEPYRPAATASGAARRVAMLDVRGRVEVLQAGRVWSGSAGMPLYAGDEIRTFAGSYALCRFADGNRVWLDEDTRVRLGSVFTFFGRVFAAVSGVFAVDSEFVAASSEGTEYTVAIDRRRPQFSVAVRTGTVLCQPRRGRWRPLRLMAGERLSGHLLETPSVNRLDAREYPDEFGWVGGTPGAPGWSSQPRTPRREFGR